jgi:predicted anti-sigma-YlaC factor YlaD
MCPDREILSAYLDGEVNPPWDAVIADHVASCVECRGEVARMEATQRALRREAAGDWKEPMERVRRRLLAREPRPAPRTAVWRRQVSLPLPVAALVAVLFVSLGVSLILIASRHDMGYIRITKAPAGGTEYQFAVPYDKVEMLLKSVGGGDANIESVMTLPKDVKLVPVGEPRMGKATEFPRKKP